MWKKLSKKEKENIITKEGALKLDKIKLNLLNKLIDRYDLVDYSYWDSGSPIMYALEYGNFKLFYGNPYYRKSKKYGIENHPKFRHPLMDHILAFRDINKKMYIVSNPYLTDDEIREMFDEKDWRNTYWHGDYSKLKYEVLGKENSYYNPNETNLLVLSI